MRYIACVSVLLLAACNPTTTVETPWGTYASGKDVGLIVELTIDPETQQVTAAYIEASGNASPVIRAQADAWAAMSRILEAMAVNAVQGAVPP